MQKYLMIINYHHYGKWKRISFKEMENKINVEKGKRKT